MNLTPLLGSVEPVFENDIHEFDRADVAARALRARDAALVRGRRVRARHGVDRRAAERRHHCAGGPAVVGERAEFGIAADDVARRIGGQRRVGIVELCGRAIAGNDRIDDLDRRIGTGVSHAVNAAARVIGGVGAHGAVDQGDAVAWVCGGIDRAAGQRRGGIAAERAIGQRDAAEVGKDCAAIAGSVRVDGAARHRDVAIDRFDTATEPGAHVTLGRIAAHTAIGQRDAAQETADAAAVVLPGVAADRAVGERETGMVRLDATAENCEIAADQAMIEREILVRDGNASPIGELEAIADRQTPQRNRAARTFENAKRMGCRG